MWCTILAANDTLEELKSGARAEGSGVDNDDWYAGLGLKQASPKYRNKNETTQLSVLQRETDCLFSKRVSKFPRTPQSVRYTDAARVLRRRKPQSPGELLPTDSIDENSF